MHRACNTVSYQPSTARVSGSLADAGTRSHSILPQRADAVQLTRSTTAFARCCSGEVRRRTAGVAAIPARQVALQAGKGWGRVRAPIPERTRFPRHLPLLRNKCRKCNPCVRYELSPRAAHIELGPLRAAAARAHVGEAAQSAIGRRFTRGGVTSQLKPSV